MKKKIVFSFPVYASFVRNDEQRLHVPFRVLSFHFRQQPVQVIFSFLHQLLFLLLNAPFVSGYISFFAGYSSFLPGLMARLTGNPHLIILGGTDCSSFPSIQYGNFQKKLLGWFTCQSLKMASHLSPVAETLVETEYTYLDSDYPKQGFRYFCPRARAPVTTIHLGFDHQKFRRTSPKEARTFLTVAQMNPPNFYRKGIDLLFEMALRFPDCRFTVVGNTPVMKYDTVPGNVQLMPFVPYEELHSIYSRHQFYLQLSVMEGFPSAPCEAMLCECIPITSNVGALPIIVGEAGFILHHKSSDQLEELIRQALASPLHELGINARARIMKQFPLHEREKLVKLLTSLMKS